LNISHLNVSDSLLNPFVPASHSPLGPAFRLGSSCRWSNDWACSH